MDGPHDLGGREGFGPVDADEPEAPFHADWEAHMWGIARSMRRQAGWSIDWFRHCRELIAPGDRVRCHTHSHSGHTRLPT